MRDRFDATIGRAVVEGARASVQARADGTVTTLVTDGTVPSPAHRELFVLRNVDGAWLITGSMFNTIAG